MVYLSPRMAQLYPGRADEVGENERHPPAGKTAIAWWGLIWEAAPAAEHESARLQEGCDGAGLNVPWPAPPDDRALRGLCPAEIAIGSRQRADADF